MIVAVVNQKGGTGKTTTTINLGSALAKLNKKVMVVDLDAQGNLSYSLGLLEINKGMSELFHGDATIEECKEEKEGMIVLPSNVTLADTELSLADAPERESFLKKILANAGSFDYILIDCPPSLSLLTINALNAAHQVIIPMQMEVLSLQGLDLISETIQKIKKSMNPGLEILGILPVMVDSRRKLSKEVYDHIVEHYAFRVFESQIRRNVKASEAPSFGQSVINYSPTSGSAMDYFQFAVEFIQLTKRK